MVVFGFAKDYYYDNDGTLKIQVRIPSIDGPYMQTNSQSKRTYRRDADLPWYTSILLPHLPNDGDVVALMSINESKSSDFICIGLTGGSYTNGSIID